MKCRIMRERAQLDVLPDYGRCFRGSFPRSSLLNQLFVGLMELNRGAEHDAQSGEPSLCQAFRDNLIELAIFEPDLLELGAAA